MPIGAMPSSYQRKCAAGVPNVASFTYAPIVLTVMRSVTAVHPPPIHFDMSSPSAPNPLSSSAITLALGDPRYAAVLEKRFNKRYRASPDYIRVASSAEQVVSAVEDAVRGG